MFYQGKQRDYHLRCLWDFRLRGELQLLPAVFSQEHLRQFVWLLFGWNGQKMLVAWNQF